MQGYDTVLSFVYIGGMVLCLVLVAIFLAALSDAFTSYDPDDPENRRPRPDVPRPWYNFGNPVYMTDEEYEDYLRSSV